MENLRQFVIVSCLHSLHIFRFVFVGVDIAKRENYTEKGEKTRMMNGNGECVCQVIRAHPNCDTRLIQPTFIPIDNRVVFSVY